MGKLIFFSPNSVIKAFSQPEAILAQSLAYLGNEVVYVSCGTALEDHCNSMSANGVWPRSSAEEKKRICEKCMQVRDTITTTYRLKGYDLKSVLLPEDITTTNDILKAITPGNFKDLEVDGVDIGRLALFEFLIHRKRITFHFSEEEWQEVVTAIRGALLSYFGGKRIIEKEKPTAVITYGSEYSSNHAFSRAADCAGIPFYTIEAGGNLHYSKNTLNISRFYMSHFFRNLESHFIRSYQDRPVPPFVLSRITDHFHELLKGEHVFAYSSKKLAGVFNLRKKFSIQESQKIIVATMSSYDERLSGEFTGTMKPSTTAVFSSQVEWIQSVIEYVSKRPELFFLIRVHPREFPNKREGVRSEHSLLLEKLFTNLPANVAINWPTDQISLYDIAGDADVFLNAWSSVGKEMSLFGVPVVVYNSDLILYPSSLNYLGKTRDHYFEQLEKALSDGWSVDLIRNTYRWLALEYHYAQIDLSDRYPAKPRQLGMATRVGRKLIRAIRPAALSYYIEKDKLFVEQHAAPLASAAKVSALVNSAKVSLLDVTDENFLPTVSEEEEQKALKKEMKRLLEALYPEVSETSEASNQLIRNFRMAIGHTSPSLVS